MSTSHTVERIVVKVSTHSVHGTHFRAHEPRGCLILQGAAGVGQSRYAALSGHLADEGISVLTYDYSGLGASRTLPPGKSQRRPSLWGHEDQAAMIAWARARYPGRRLSLLGHSLGGQILGFSPRVADIDRFVLVAAQCPYVGNWRDPGDRRKVQAIWSILFPGACRVFGYLPSRVHGGDEAIPRAASAEGERWATHPWRRLLDEPGVRDNLALIRAPVRAYSFSDDRLYAPREAVDVFTAGLTHAPVERLHLAPHEVGLDRIGHFGFFSRKSATLWRGLAEYLTLDS